VTATTLRTLLFVLLLVLPLAACSGGGSEEPFDPAPGPGDGGEDPPAGPDGATLYADAGCGDCHGADGASGFAVSIACYPADGLDAYVRTEGSPHTGGSQPAWTDDELSALQVFLGGDTCDANVPASHTVSNDGVMHRPGFADAEANCTPCHGADLGGFGSVPSCASCHDAGGNLTCTGCHAVAQDNGDDLPLGGRRGVIAEFSLPSHHLSGEMTDADCQVCHDMSAHMQGSVRLLDADDPTTAPVVVLTGDPLTSATEAVKLEPFCLACHDDDGANGFAPFSNGVVPASIDATAWASSSHGLSERTCMGDGETFGCHGSGHGSTKRLLLGPFGGSASGVTGDTTREEEGFCYTCHQDGGEASTDIETEFGRTTHHIIGSHEQGTTIQLECTSCHDPHRATSANLLRDPDDGSAWTGTFQAFCLTCHDGDPPDDVSFPTTSSGTGFDKSAFAGTTHATELGSDSCLDCHLRHGSANRAILQSKYVVADRNQRTSGDYAACWDCHSSSTILSGANAFDDLHDKHVLDKDFTCAECHDVHGGYDSAEPGLISFSFALSSGWTISLSGSTTLSSAFQFNASTGVGSCALTCHSENHNPETYAAGN
jgi:predicted CXXCH cytochrome family protein